MTYKRNPLFDNDLDTAIGRALRDVADDLERRGRANAGWSRSVRRKLHAEIEKDSRGAHVRFTTGGGLQNVAERPKSKRRTRKGHNRGWMRQFPVIEPTAKEVLGPSPDISRYLARYI